MNPRAVFIDPPKPLPPWLRDGYLGFCLALLGWHAWWLWRHSWVRGHDSITLVLVALLLNHVAFRYPWPRPVMILLRIAACAWIVLALYLALRLLPSPSE
jgi:hypothetical protein